jgi:hypothetical protein
MPTTQLPPVIGQAVNELTRKYSESPATTNAGRVLRFFARFVTVDDLLKLLTHKNK